MPDGEIVTRIDPFDWDDMVANLKKDYTEFTPVTIEAMVTE
jgi:hypothetical protein